MLWIWYKYHFQAGKSDFRFSDFCFLWYVDEYIYLIKCNYQAKILYKDIPFTDEERESIKFIIQSNLYGYLGILLEGRERFEDESLNEIKKTESSTGRDLLLFHFTRKSIRTSGY